MAKTREEWEAEYVELGKAIRAAPTADDGTGRGPAESSSELAERRSRVAEAAAAAGFRLNCAALDERSRREWREEEAARLAEGAEGAKTAPRVRYWPRPGERFYMEGTLHDATKPNVGIRLDNGVVLWVDPAKCALAKERPRRRWFRRR
ncbi:MAG TPA: hypothetical protein VEL02_15035 [Jatrophihabitantaceae bacterium]|nr:hypothetical protein [Jatrophihabitantaceae bacterium]